jgi:integrase
VYNTQGKRIRKSQIINASNIDEARERLRDLTGGNALITREKEIKRNLDALDGVAAERHRWEAAQPALSVEDAFSAYNKSGLRSDSGARTLADYEGYCNGLVQWLAANRPQIKELREISQSDAEAFAADLRAKRSAGTYNKRIVFFRCLWRTLMDADAGKDTVAKNPVDRPARLTANPWNKIQKRELDTHSRRELTIEELGRVAANATGELRLLLAIGLYTGLRLGDCALLEWKSIDMVRGRIALIPRKTARHAHGKPVVIPIHAALAALLDETPSDKRTGYVLPETANAYNREPSLVTNRIQKHFQDCGIKTSTKRDDGQRALTEVGFHSLRHTFVSLSANAGAPLVLVQSIVGHSNPAMTRHYFHEQEKALKSTVAALPDITNGTIDAEIPTKQENDAPGKDIDTNGATPLQTFKAAYMALTDTERKTAAAWIAKQDKSYKH